MLMIVLTIISLSENYFYFLIEEGMSDRTAVEMNQYSSEIDKSQSMEGSCVAKINACFRILPLEFIIFLKKKCIGLVLGTPGINEFSIIEAVQGAI